MATNALIKAQTQLETLFRQGMLGTLTDSELLGIFLTGEPTSAEAAFATLVDLHGPMVMRVCRSALGSAHDAEDASQAVFLILARRAGSVRRRDSAASWLYGVARRISARIRRDEARRRKHELRKAEMRSKETLEPLRCDSHEDLFSEIDGLPDVYRRAFVLCYLQGRSHEQAAILLRCPLRTLQSRLLRAKERLRGRLSRRGVSLASILPLASQTAPPPAGWVGATARAVASGRASFTKPGVTTNAIKLSDSFGCHAMSALWRIAVALVVSLSVLTLIAVRGPGPASTTATLKAKVPQPQAVARPARDPNNRTLLLRVVDRQTKAPIEGAQVTVEIDSGARVGLGGEPEIMAPLATDAAGQRAIGFPPVLPKEIVITARKPGYANRSYGPFQETGGGAMPGNHEIEMEHGVTIGGIVKAPDGSPVSGATVVIMARAGAESSPDWTYVSEVNVKTDAQGRWRFDEMPTAWSFVSLRVTHPDYVSTFMQRERPKFGDFDLKAKQAEVTLESGIAITGRVVDDQGRAIAGAEVALGSDRQIMQRGFPSVSADSEGRFRFGHVPAGAQTVTARAPGRSPEFTDVVVSPELKPLEFRLGPGHLLKGRVVNQEGKPVDGATVQAMNWRGHMSLDWRTKTDAEGRFTWDSAPPDPVLLTLTRPGFVMLGQREFRPGKEETTVTMYPPLRVRGKVTDARTEKSIAQFTVVPGTYHQSANRRRKRSEPNWDRRAPWQDLGDGRFEIEYAHALVEALVVRVEARGYKPATSEIFLAEAGTVTFDPKLEPGLGPSGSVLGLDGRPLPGASVVLSTRSQRAQLYNTKFHEGGYQQVATGVDGRFSFPAQSEPFRVFVDHATGFVEADEKALANSAQLTIKPWGRIEGLVKIGMRPAVGVEIRLSETDNRWNPDEALPITQAQQVSTDRRGHYTFEHVIPGRLRVSRIFSLERSSFHMGTGASRIVTIKPKVATWVGPADPSSADSCRPPERSRELSSVPHPIRPWN
jgi:RNA polymerase sigma factor (sigma-70 family)